MRCSVVSQTALALVAGSVNGPNGSTISVELCEFGEFFEDTASGDKERDESSLPARTNELKPAETNAAVSRCSVFFDAGKDPEITLSENYLSKCQIVILRLYLC